jgi:hypothetical protein
MFDMSFSTPIPFTINARTYVLAACLLETDRPSAQSQGVSPSLSVGLTCHDALKPSLASVQLKFLNDLKLLLLDICFLFAARIYDHLGHKD